jgi:hypothetical protein
MAKADLALFGGSSLYADAVESGLPSYIWRASQSGYEPITAAFNDYIDSSNKEQAIDTQRRLLDRQISQLQGNVAIANRQHDFSTVFQQLLSHLHTGANAATDHDATLASTNIKHNDDSHADALRVIDQPALWQKNTWQQQLSRSAWKNKRKLAKFCESPERFMQDSNNRIVRQFLTLLK